LVISLIVVLLPVQQLFQLGLFVLMQLVAQDMRKLTFFPMGKEKQKKVMSSNARQFQ